MPVKKDCDSTYRGEFKALVVGPIALCHAVLPQHGVQLAQVVCTDWMNCEQQQSRVRLVRQKAVCTNPDRHNCAVNRCCRTQPVCRQSKTHRQHQVAA